MKQKHPIKVVANRTGMSPHLIRIWERRYQAVTPDRTDTGRRLYTDEDIERLILLRQATLIGESISQIASLSLEQLTQLLPGSINQTANVIEPIRSVDEIDEHLKLCMDAIKNLDSVNLEARLLRASIGLGQELFLEQVLQPLLKETGEMWADGHLKVAHEHLASAVIRSLLGSLYVSARNDNAGPLLISTTPMGQLHEFGALMVSVTAVSSRWRASYLGPNLPAEEIATAVVQGNAHAVALSIVYPPHEPQIIHELRKLRQMIPAHVNILVGGQSAESYASTLDEINAVRVTSLSNFKKQLNRLRLTTINNAAN